MKKRTIDLSKQPLKKAKKMMNDARIKYKGEQIHFILPNRGEVKAKSASNPALGIFAKCPQCNSRLQSKGDEITCTSSNMDLILADLKFTKERYGDKADLFISKTAYRFLDQYLKDPQNVKCDFYYKKGEF